MASLSAALSRRLGDAVQTAMTPKGQELGLWLIAAARRGEEFDRLEDLPQDVQALVEVMEARAGRGDGPSQASKNHQAP